MKVQDVVTALESLAPPSLAAEWDNVGLLVGDSQASVRKILFCIDLTEPVMEEAIGLKAEMVMAYHPPIFKGLSRLTAQQSPVVYRAARRGLSVYSMHTALDAAVGGTNDVLAGLLGLSGCVPLEPAVQRQQCKIVVFVPPDDLSGVAEAAFSAGAGRIGNYYDCAFFAHGIGSFCGGKGSHPTLGHAGRHEATEELRLEVIAPRDKAGDVCAAIRGAHSYEQPAIDVYPMRDYPEGCGMGRIGRLDRAASAASLIARIKKAARLRRVLVVPASKAAGKAGPVRVAACGAGSCGTLFHRAIADGATFYLTGEMRHHDALAAAAAGLTVVCLGHSNSERLALPVVARHAGELLPGISVALSRRDRDPFEIV